MSAERDTPEQFARDLDALHTRLIKLATREGGALGDDIAGVGGYLTDALGDLNFAIEKQAERDAEDTGLRGKCPDQAYDEARDDRMYRQMYGEV